MHVVQIGHYYSIKHSLLLFDMELRHRIKRFAVRVFNLIDHIPDNPKGRVIQHQLAAAASSAAANYRAAQRSRSRAEFISKLSTTFEETDESAFWIEMLVETGMIRQQRVTNLQREADELCAIIATSRNTARKNAKSRVEGDRKT
jgi:four helix bundle protein